MKTNDLTSEGLVPIERVEELIKGIIADLNLFLIELERRLKER